MTRNQASRSWVTKAIVYPLSSALAGFVTGGLLGGAGSLLPLDVRVAAGSTLAVVASFLGGLEFLGYGVQPLQRDCETPQRWINKGPLRWAIQNGVALGFGGTSRIGFLLWYAVPLGALLLGDWVLGAAVYGTYGLVRGTAAPLMLLGGRFSKTEVSGWLIDREEAAQVLSAGQLVLLGVTVTVFVGL